MRDELLAVPEPEPGDADVDAGLRPRRLAEFVGQAELKDHLDVMLEAARRRGQPVDHLLFAGPPGLGKTTLAGIVANELGVTMHVTSGPAFERAGDVAAVLTKLDEGDVLFIDEIHRLARPVEEVLYPAMEDFELDIVLGKGPAARTLRLDLPHFTLIGATTRTGLITGPLRDRFGYVARLDYYSACRPRDHRRADAPASSACRSRPPAPPRSAAGRGARPASPTGCCAGCATTPRCGVGAWSTRPPPMPAWRCSASTSWASTRSTGPSSRPSAAASAGGPVGLSTLAISVGEPTETVEDVYEPFLIQRGLLMRTPRGRVATAAAWQHLGLSAPASQAVASDAAPSLFG